MSDWDFHYPLPPDLIAQAPASPRDHSRLLVIDRLTGELNDEIFSRLPVLLPKRAVLVFNQSAVIPARLYGVKSTGGKVEILLLRKLNNGNWNYLSHPGIKPSQCITIGKTIAHITAPNQLHFTPPLTPQILGKLGQVPLPPYIHSSASQTILRRQYQTVYARVNGSAAAPTAGLHFTKRLLSVLLTRGIKLESLVLHVGLGTFQSPTTDQLKSGKLHAEFYSLPAATARRLNTYKTQGRPIIAVGTTTTRVLETCADSRGLLRPGSGDTNIFIRPGYSFKFVDGLITNFHLPDSSLLMLISAFASPQIIRTAYQHAIESQYRFYSFGDACLII